MFSEAIPPSVAAILRDIHNWQLPLGTYMAGGTAVAAYLGHRESLDIDLFTDKEFYCGPIISSLRQKHDVTVTNVAEKDTLIAIVDNIRLSLFNYPYPLIKPLINNPDYNIELASPEDIASMKVVAIAQRGIAKDFVDLQALIVAYGLSLDYLMSQVQKKFGVSEAYSYQIKKSLVYFDDALRSLGDVTVLRDGKEARLEKNEWSRIEDFFKKFVLGH
ncbi:MAG: nucleotidyl transferase AbiEii/AbiGii toxin family protein [Planctomycetota bacterium]